jgi:hypothetical protein
VTQNFASGLIVSAFFFQNEGLESAISKQNPVGVESESFQKKSPISVSVPNFETGPELQKRVIGLELTSSQNGFLSDSVKSDLSKVDWGDF